MKEDVLEQILDDFLKFKGYFTRHNVKFKPKTDHLDFSQNKDAVASDIDVIGYNPNLTGPERVIVASCKSYQAGFDPASMVRKIDDDKVQSGRQAWQGFRELVKPKWAEAFRSKVIELTGSDQFVYWTVVTSVKNPGGISAWTEKPLFRENIQNEIRIVSLSEMLDELWKHDVKTPEASEIGRLIQLIKASGWTWKG
jgi:hypothetical protein